MRGQIKKAKRIIFKIGSSTLLDAEGRLDGPVLHQLAALWSLLHREGREIVIVTSGAIALGWPFLGLQAKPKSIPEQQAAAAIGQSMLMAMYASFFQSSHIAVGQILLTRDDIADRRRYLNARNTLNVLLDKGIIPIINENDTVAYEEIKFGENDTLAAMVAGLVNGDLVVLLSDIDGLYSNDPRKDPNAHLLSLVEEITPAIEALAGGSGSSMGSGGMKTKIEAAKIAGQSGIPLIIAMGKDVEAINGILAGEEKGTLFLAKDHALGHKKRWIAYGSSLEGAVTIDDGAKEALLFHGKSLLPVGAIAVEGAFGRGSVIAIKDKDGMEIARGIVNYDAADIGRILGSHSDRLAEILGEEGDCFHEIVHRDNLVLQGNGG